MPTSFAPLAGLTRSTTKPFKTQEHEKATMRTRAGEKSKQNRRKFQVSPVIQFPHVTSPLQHHVQK